MPEPQHNVSVMALDPQGAHVNPSHNSNPSPDSYPYYQPGAHSESMLVLDSDMYRPYGQNSTPVNVTPVYGQSTPVNITPVYGPSGTPVNLAPVYGQNGTVVDASSSFNSGSVLSALLS